MKNLLKAAMVALLLTPLVGCGSKGSEKQGSNTAETHGKTYNVEMCIRDRYTCIRMESEYNKPQFRLKQTGV